MKANSSRIKTICYTMAYVLIAILWGYLHIYRLNSVPSGLNIDEAGMAYDAFCVLNWGVDRYLNPYPLYFYNMGGGQSALYVYMCAFFIKIFGMDTFVFRIPAMIFSLITIIFSSLIVKECYGKKWSVVNALLVCFLPYFTMQSRFGLDCNLMLGAVTVCIYLTIKVLQKEKGWMYPLLGVAWGVTLYTYVLSYIIVPFFLVMLFGLLLYQRKISIKKILWIVIPIILVALPLIAMVIINVFDLETIRTDFFTIYRLQDGRVNELGLGNLWDRIKDFLYAIFIYDDLPYNGLPDYHTLYLFSIPFVIIGFVYNAFIFVKSLINKDENTLVTEIMFLYFLAQFTVGCMLGKVNVSRMNAIFLPLLFFIVSGIYVVSRLVWKLSKRIFPAVLSVVIVMMCYGVHFMDFSNYYYNVYPKSLYSMFLFSERLDEVVSVFDVRIQNYKTYVDAYYLYYVIEKRTNPYLIDLKLADNYQFDNIIFNSSYTVFPKNLKEYDIYVINRWNETAIEVLSQGEFYEHWTDDYVIFYSENVK